VIARPQKPVGNVFFTRAITDRPYGITGRCAINPNLRAAARKSVPWIDFFGLSMYNICGKYKGGRTPFKRKENCHDL